MKSSTSVGLPGQREGALEHRSVTELRKASESAHGCSGLCEIQPLSVSTCYLPACKLLGAVLREIRDPPGAPPPLAPQTAIFLNKPGPETGESNIEMGGVQRMFVAAHRCVQCGSGSKIIIITIITINNNNNLSFYLREVRRQPIIVWQI